MPVINCSKYCRRCQDSCYFTYFDKADRIRVTDRSQLKEGDHLEFWRGHQGHCHHALYVKDGEGEDMINVIHGTSGAECKPSVRQEDIHLNQWCTRTFVVDHSNLYGKLNGHGIIEEAKEEMGKKWEAWTFNCEHIVRLAQYREARERDEGLGTESDKKRMHIRESHQVQCMGFALMQSFLLFFIRAFWRIALYVFINFGVKTIKPAVDGHEICSPEKEARQQLFFEVVIGCLMAAAELMFLIIECRCCCGGEFCCGSCQCACRSQRCCCCTGGTLFPIKVRKFIISLFRVAMTIGFTILFEQQFGSPCDVSQVMWSVLGSFVGAIVGTVFGWYIGTWIAFLIEIYCMESYVPSELEDRAEKIVYTAINVEKKET